jgi:non-ribosomal peptide synthetase component F
MNIAEIFEQQARTRPNAAAILDVLHGRERTLTFAELMNKAAEVVSLLHSQGLRAGDGVVILHRMSPARSVPIGCGRSVYGPLRGARPYRTLLSHVSSQGFLR